MRIRNAGKVTDGLWCLGSEASNIYLIRQSILTARARRSEMEEVYLRSRDMEPRVS